MVIVPEYFFQKYPGMMGATKVVRMVIVPEYLFFPERIFAPDRSDYSETRKERIKGLLPVHPIMRERWMTHTLTNSCSYMTHSVRGERVAIYDNDDEVGNGDDEKDKQLQLHDS